MSFYWDGASYLLQTCNKPFVSSVLVLPLLSSLLFFLEILVLLAENKGSAKSNRINNLDCKSEKFFLQNIDANHIVKLLFSKGQLRG